MYTYVKLIFYLHAYYSTYVSEHYRTFINTENRARIISFYCKLLTIYHGSVTLVQLKNFTVRIVPWEVVNDSRDEKNLPLFTSPISRGPHSIQRTIIYCSKKSHAYI